MAVVAMRIAGLTGLMLCMLMTGETYARGPANQVDLEELVAVSSLIVLAAPLEKPVEHVKRVDGNVVYAWTTRRYRIIRPLHPAVFDKKEITVSDFRQPLFDLAAKPSESENRYYASSIYAPVQPVDKDGAQILFMNDVPGSDPSSMFGAVYNLSIVGGVEAPSKETQIKALLGAYPRFD